MKSNLEKAKTYLHHKKFSQSNNRSAVLIQDAINAVEMFNRWIYISENNLPDNDTEVVFITDLGDKYVGKYNITNKMFYFERGGVKFYVNNVVAYYLLPLINL